MGDEVRLVPLTETDVDGLREIGLDIEERWALAPAEDLVAQMERDIRSNDLD